MSNGFDFEYAPAPESRAIVSIEKKYGLFIDGKFTAPNSRKSFPTLNPATEEKLSDISLADHKDVNLAVKAARKSFTKSWSKLSGKERGKYL